MSTYQKINQIILDAYSWDQFCAAMSRLEKKEKGTVFEFFTKYYLLTNPMYAADIQNIFQHSELPFDVIQTLDLPTPEIGVDLIVQTKDAGYWAIQCKFHQDSSYNVTYNEVSTFFSVTERENTFQQLSHRLISTSAVEISKNVTKLHDTKLGFITSSDFEVLDEKRFKQIHAYIKGLQAPLDPYTPREHQVRAIKKTKEYFEQPGSDRGKIIHPCGSGKSLTAYWIAKEIGATSVLLAVPSLALIRQTLDAWTSQASSERSEIEYLVICSDKDVDKRDDPSLTISDLGIRVTTDSELVENFLRRSNNKLKLILTTYQSGQIIIAASTSLNYTFDFAIYDEAHKTAGDKGKKFSLLVNDEKISAKKKIFMTATERIITGTNKVNVVSMDDPDIYGQLIDQISFRQALELRPPILSDYRVITFIVTKGEIETLVRDNKRIKVNGSEFTVKEDGTTLAALVALRKLTQEHNIRHAISFHNSISRAQDFSKLITSENLSADFSGDLFAYHVSGNMSMGKRNEEINKFKNNSPSVVSNARCLTEGVDIPAVDAVIFADPKQGVIDIVQAAGRAMRLHPKKKLGYIIIPVIVDDNTKNATNASFGPLINVIAALGINDDRIIDEAKAFTMSKKCGDGASTPPEPPIIDFAGIDFERFVEDVKLSIWDRVSFAKSVVGESEFNRWMKNQKKANGEDVAPTTIEKYTRVVRKISNDLVRLNLAYSSLEEITDKADLDDLKEKYFSIKEYRDLDKRGNQMYSAGFNQLIKYQLFRQGRKDHFRQSKHLD